MSNEHNRREDDEPTPIPRRRTGTSAIQSTASLIGILVGVTALACWYSETAKNGKLGQLLSDVTEQVREIKTVNLPLLGERVSSLEKGGSSGLLQHIAKDEERDVAVSKREDRLEDSLAQFVRDFSDVKSNQKVVLSELAELKAQIDELRQDLKQFRKAP